MRLFSPRKASRACWQYSAGKTGTGFKLHDTELLWAPALIMYLKQNHAIFQTFSTIQNLWVLSDTDQSLPDEVFKKLLLQNMQIMYNKIKEDLKKWTTVKYPITKITHVPLTHNRTTVVSYLNIFSKDAIYQGYIIISSCFYV